MVYPPDCKSPLTPLLQSGESAQLRAVSVPHFEKGGLGGI